MTEREMVRRFEALERKVLELRQSLPNLPVRWGQQGRSPTLYIKLAGATSIGDNRWSYNYEVVAPIAGGLFEQVNELTQEDYGPAYNTIETNNSATSAFGVDLTIEPFASGRAYFVSAAEGEPVVRAERRTVEGASVVYFEAWNAIHDDCEEEA